MLGQTNIQTTQIYARITDQKVDGDMKMLSGKVDEELVIWAQQHGLTFSRP